MSTELVTQYSIREGYARSEVQAEYKFRDTFALDSLDAPEWLPDGGHKGFDGELCGTVYRSISAIGVLRGLTP